MRHRSLLRTLAALSTVSALAAVSSCADGETTTQPTPATTAAPTTAHAASSTTAASTTAPAPAPSTTAQSTTTSTVAPTTTAPTLTPNARDITVVAIASGLRQPLDLAWRADDPVPYVVQREGLVLRIRNGGPAEVALDLRNEISLKDVQGLLGLTFHPTAPLAYVDYNDVAGSVTVAEYAVRDDGTLDAASKRVLLSIAQQFPNHNGGQLAFGPDGYLYVSVGDGSGGRDGLRTAQNLGDLHGKILRIDPTPGDGASYTVPADNPFVATAGARPEIWAYGLRNPWRFSFDPATGDLWIGDVGENRFEEVNLARAADGGGRGANFGWSAFEGTRPYNTDQSAPGHVPPVHAYTHGDDDCSITGGAVYRGNSIPSLYGWYVFADYCSGDMWAFVATPGAAVVRLGSRGLVSALVSGPDGTMYVLEYSAGRVLAIVPR